MSHYRRDVVGRGISTGLGLGLRRRLSGGGGDLPTLFKWRPISGQALLATSTFVRGTVGWYRNDSGVWEEEISGQHRYHNAVLGGGGKGYLPEHSATKLALFPRDFTNGVWSATNITAAKDATGIDAVANAASTLTADANNGTIFQSFTRASSAHSFQCFVSRKTGSGTVEITIDGGTTWVDITSSLTSSIDNPFVVTQTLANPSIGFRLGTSGDEIEVDMADLEATAYATTPLDHTSSTATRAADSLTDSALLTAQHSALFDITCPDVADNQSIIGFVGASRVTFANASAFQYSSGLSMAVIAGSTLTGERHKILFSAEENNGVIIDDEGNSGTDTSGTPSFGVTLKIGMRATGINQFRGVMHEIIIWSVIQTQAELEGRV